MWVNNCYRPYLTLALSGKSKFISSCALTIIVEGFRLLKTTIITSVPKEACENLLIMIPQILGK